MCKCTDQSGITLSLYAGYNTHVLDTHPHAIRVLYIPFPARVEDEIIARAENSSVYLVM